MKTHITNATVFRYRRPFGGYVVHRGVKSLTPATKKGMMFNVEFHCDKHQRRFDLYFVGKKNTRMRCICFMENMRNLRT